jgi:DNA-binding CsgD family transcriptional regulator
MYLAPLNYDRFFKKVFGKKRFAKAFLEDFLNINIKKIEILERKNFITDKALPIEFDYRCSLDNGEQVIVEMQQWYKTDITRRFYLYHSLSTSLQLENLEEEIVSIDNKTGKIIRDKLYNNLKPSITLIWMVDDNLNFTEDFVTFKMGVEDLHNFVKDDDIWNKSFDKILAERERVLNLQNNNTKDLDFLSKNKLTFIFQKNIAKNISKNKQDKYSKWFDFALKTKNKKNKKSDFKDYENNELFISIMNVLLKDKLTEEEIKYISKEDELKDAYVKYTSVLINAQKKAQNAEKEAESAQKEAENAQKEAKNALKEKEQAQKREEKILKASITKFLALNLSISEIAEVLGVSEELVKSLIN